MDAVVADLAHDAAGLLEEAQVGERYARGFTHVSDHAKHALDP